MRLQDQPEARLQIRSTDGDGEIFGAADEPVAAVGHVPDTCLTRARHVSSGASGVRVWQVGAPAHQA